MKTLADYTVEIEVSLDRWQSEQDLAYLSILVGVEISEQEESVQELVTVSI